MAMQSKALQRRRENLASFHKRFYLLSLFTSFHYEAHKRQTLFFILDGQQLRQTIPLSQRKIIQYVFNSLPRAINIARRSERSKCKWSYPLHTHDIYLCIWSDNNTRWTLCTCWIRHLKYLYSLSQHVCLYFRCCCEWGERYEWAINTYIVETISIFVYALAIR